MIGSLVGIGAEAGLGLLGELLANQSSEQQRQLLQQVMDEYGNIDLPKLQQLAAEQVGPTELSKIQDNPEYVDAQKGALRSLMDMGRNGGYTLEDRANMSRLLSQSALQDRAARQHISDDMAARGMGGGGSELAMRMSAAQAGAQRNAQNALDVASEGQKRGFQALLEGGRLGGQIRSQDYDEKARAAQAQDLINRYNADARSKVAAYNAQLPQQNYENQLRKEGGRASAAGAVANTYGQEADRTRSLYGGLGKAAYDAGRSYDPNSTLGSSTSGLSGTTQQTGFGDNSVDPDSPEGIARRKAQGY